MPRATPPSTVTHHLHLKVYLVNRIPTMETYTFPHFPSYASPIHIALFEDVGNSSEIRKKLIEASTMAGPEGDEARDKVDFGFIDASLIVSRQHLITALYSTVFSTLPTSPETTPKTRTHNLHSEILLGLSLGTNITDSIRRHGISNDSKRVLVVRIGGQESAEVVREGMKALVDGESVGLEELDRGTGVDWSRVDKVYKMAEMNQLKDPELLQKKVAAVETAVAIKSVT